MKKDKKWLKQEIENMCPMDVNGEEYLDLDRVFELVDQLDDQSRQIENMQRILDKQNEIISKTSVMFKPQKVTVPKWFDEWVKSKLESWLMYDCLDLAHCMIEDYNNGKLTDEQEGYVIDHPRDILSALLHGYEVEEEKLYWVRDKCDCALLRRVGDSLMQSNSASNCEQEATPENYQFTEQEIKDYDERYIPFMVPVEEVDNE